MLARSSLLAPCSRLLSHSSLLSSSSSSLFLRSSFSHAVRPFSIRSYSTESSTTAGKANFGLVIVPQQSAYVIEYFGRFHSVLKPGLHFLIPIVHRIAYIHNLKEQAIPVMAQQAITADNVTIRIDGVLYIRIIDPEKASYGVTDIYYAMTQLAQTAMRSELGKITLDKTFAERESLNLNIVKGLAAAAEPWGIECLRYEIRDIDPPPSVKQAMDMQAEAERQKRATILNSEGAQQSAINVADGERQATVLAAQAEAAAIVAKAQARAKGIETLALAIAKRNGRDAVNLMIAEQYINAFSNLAKTNNTLLMPANVSDPSSMIAQAMGIFAAVNKTTQGAGAVAADADKAAGKTGKEMSKADLEEMADLEAQYKASQEQQEQNNENVGNIYESSGVFNPVTGRVQ